MKRTISQKKLTDQNQVMDDTEYLMSSDAMADVIRQGQEDIMQGRGKVVILDELWK